MTPAKSGDPDVEAGGALRENVKNTGVRGFGLCELRGTPSCRVGNGSGQKSAARRT